MHVTDPFDGVTWSNCSASCGGGRRFRETKTDPRVVQEIECNTQSCDPIIGDCKADVILLLDSSYSQDALKWFILKQIAIDVVQSLKIHEDQIRIGVISFSTVIGVDIYLGQYTTTSDLMSAIWDIDYMAGDTNFKNALRRMRDMFNRYKRYYVKQVAVLITNTGHSVIDPRGTRDVVQEAASDGIEIFVFVKGDCTADVIFLLDASGSYDSLKWFAQKQLVIDVVQGLKQLFDVLLVKVITVSLHVGADDTRIGVISFSTKARQDISLRQYNKTSDLTSAIWDIDYMAKATNFFDGIQSMQLMFKRNNRFGREIGVLVTHSVLSRHPFRTKLLEMSATKHGIDMFVIAAEGTASVAAAAEAAAAASKASSSSSSSSSSSCSSKISVAFRLAESALSRKVSPRNEHLLNHRYKFDRLMSRSRCSSIASSCSSAQSAPCGGGRRSRETETKPRAVQEIGCNMQSCDPVVGDCKADVILLLDSSYGQDALTWFILKQIAIDVVQSLKVGYYQTRVGVISFSTMVRSDIYLGQYVETSDVVSAIWDIEYMAGGTYFKDALQNMTNMFKQYKRAYVKQIAVLITHTDYNTDHTGTQDVVEEAASDGIEIFVFSVGTNVDHQIAAIATDPDFVYSSEAFRGLDRLTQSMRNATCKVGNKRCGGGSQTRGKFCNGVACGSEMMACNKMPCDDPYDGVPWLNCSAPCGGGWRHRYLETNHAGQEIACNTQPCDSATGDCRADVIFVLDSSANNGAMGWFTVKQFVIDLVQSLKVAEHQTRIGVISFSTMVRSDIYPGQYNKTSDLLSAIWDINYMAGDTNVADALHEMRDMFSHYKRPTVKQIAILVTLGVFHSDIDAAIISAKEAADDGIDIFVLDECHLCNYTNGQIWLPDSVNCHMFYLCEKIGDEVYIRHDMTCGELWWQQDIHTCVRSPPEGCAVNVPVNAYVPVSTTEAPCPYEPVPDKDGYFRLIDNPNEMYRCVDGMVFINPPCVCVQVSEIKLMCSDDLLLYFSYEDHYNDVTCHQAIATQYGHGVERKIDPSRNDSGVACFSGQTHFEVPFLRTWFAENKVDKFSITVWFQRHADLFPSAGIVNNNNCQQRAGFSLSCVSKQPDGFDAFLPVGVYSLVTGSITTDTEVNFYNAYVSVITIAIHRWQ
ncbi:hypothetical protein LSAT2_027886 [Lamellibrachia satsuma]|nr:hypothetical protein LSAT2_027886 [Lamellibrachia satsuma]